MARTATILTIFLASPSDVSKERDVVSRTVARWNSLHSQSKSVIFELLKWEDSVAAGFGHDGQDVINQQIPPYDLLISLFWTRLGTPTPRSISGSSEEYEIALTRLRSGEAVEISFYFKDAPFNPREVNLSQLSLVYEFEKKVQFDGAFTKRFTDEDSLQFEIDLLLDKVSGRLSGTRIALSNTSSNQNAAALATIATVSADDEDGDLGLFDISDSLQAHSLEATRLLGLMTDRLNELAATTSEVNKSLSDISATRPLEPADVKPLIKRMSANMNEYSEFVEDHSANYAENIFLMSNDIRNLIEVSKDFSHTAPDGLTNLEFLRQTLETMIVNTSSSNESMIGMRDTTASLQRTTSEFNKSKRRVVKNIDILIEINKSIISINENSIFELDKLIFSIKSRKD